MNTKKEESPGDVAKFEAALNELEQIVSKLERGDLKLEESLKLFERGVALTKQCRKSLETAELTVKQLLGDMPGEPTDNA
jgi:exodeoxyribonuclease VII small subunit